VKRTRIAALLLLFWASAAAAQGDALRAWQKEQKSLDRDERKFWNDFKSRFSEALQEFQRPVADARDKPTVHKEAVYDYAGIEQLFKQYAGIAIARGEADMKLAKSGNEKAAVTLGKELLGSAKRMDALAAGQVGGTPNFGRYTFNQEPGCQLYGLRTLNPARVNALGHSKGALDYLTATMWKSAARSDGKKSHTRRVMVIDALGASGDEGAIPFLTERLVDKTPAVRMAAIEALAPFGSKTRAALLPRLGDESSAARRALLASVLAADPADPGWFGPAIAHAAKARGVERDLCVRVLAKISRQKFGHDLAGWNEWYGEYKQELESGKFDAETVEVVDRKPKADPDAIGFYGLSISSTGAAFVVDGSQHMAMPADWEVQRTQWRDLWRGTRSKWEKEHESHKAVLLRELAKATSSFPRDFGWGIGLLHAAFTVKTIGEKKLLKPSKRDVAAAVKLIEKAPTKGWCSPLEGLRAGAQLGGKQNEVLDTVVLWATGDPAGGRYMTADSAAQAWAVFNRFRRLRVHCIRISNRKEQAEKFMQQVAASSGGTYLWASTPPAK
jgi:hypothetical protein